MKLLVASATLLSVASALAQYTCEVLPMPTGYRAQANAVGFGKVVGTTYIPGGGQRACIWEGPNHTFRMLTNQGSFGAAVAEHAQGGDLNNGGATFWLDDTRGDFQLNTTPINGPSGLNGMDGSSFVGYAIHYTGGHALHHALLWLNNGATLIDLTPAGFEIAVATSISGDIQVGFVQSVFNRPQEAAIWRGSAESMQTLSTPHRVASPAALSVKKSAIVGYYYSQGVQKPVLWNADTLASQELPLPRQSRPYESIYGFASGTNGTVHVGKVSVDLYPGFYKDLAIAWVDNPPRLINLNEFLPPNLAGADCYATGIDEDGNIVGWATTIPSVHRAVIWKPIK